MMMDLENNIRLASQGMDELKAKKDMAAQCRVDSPAAAPSTQLQISPPQIRSSPSSAKKAGSRQSVTPTPSQVTSPDPPQPPTLKQTVMPQNTNVIFSALSGRSKSLSSPPSPAPGKVTFNSIVRKTPSPPPPPSEKIQKVKTRLTCGKQDTFNIPRISRERSILHMPHRQKTIILTSQVDEFPVERRNSIPLRRQSTVVDFPIRPAMVFRQHSQLGFQNGGSCFPEVIPLPPIRRSKTYIENVASNQNKRSFHSAVSKYS